MIEIDNTTIIFDLKAGTVGAVLVVASTCIISSLTAHHLGYTEPLDPLRLAWSAAVLNLRHEQPGFWFCGWLAIIVGLYIVYKFGRVKVPTEAELIDDQKKGRNTRVSAIYNTKDEDE